MGALQVCGKDSCGEGSGANTSRCGCACCSRELRECESPADRNRKHLIVRGERHEQALVCSENGVAARGFDERSPEIISSVRKQKRQLADTRLYEEEQSQRQKEIQDARDEVKRLQEALRQCHSLLQEIEQDDMRERRRLLDLQAEAEAQEAAKLKLAAEENARREREDMSAVEAWLEDNDFPSINIPRRKGMWRKLTYPLHWAIQEGDRNRLTVERLLRCKADVTAVNGSKQTPLALACRLNKRGSHEVLVHILKSACV
eukprot:gnl/TRDRNA2_/TRDRNA2_33650_c0_seq1.p1 gnl/TRDRNA2_/TRDRNA2_33650_c0~~gnl/TRDRNA2_/TRDRNA2_33650_c0_seq1.p1  ORF type:complete len:260 (+),score=56.51 gnl/TRDRNA2_/TRDRNA2_33650_c0_seq1:87-866(+)